MTARLRRRVAGRRAGLLAVLANDAERQAFRGAAAAAGLDLTAWARGALLAAAAECDRPPRPPPSPPLFSGVCRRGRPALHPIDRRDRQIKIGLTVAERRQIDQAAKAAGRLVSQWARAVLWSALTPEDRPQ